MTTSLSAFDAVTAHLRFSPESSTPPFVRNLWNLTANEQAMLLFVVRGLLPTDTEIAVEFMAKVNTTDSDTAPTTIAKYINIPTVVPSVPALFQASAGCTFGLLRGAGALAAEVGIWLDAFDTAALATQRTWELRLTVLRNGVTIQRVIATGVVKAQGSVSAGYNLDLIDATIAGPVQVQGTGEMTLVPLAVSEPEQAQMVGGMTFSYGGGLSDGALAVSQAGDNGLFVQYNAGDSIAALGGTFSRASSAFQAASITPTIFQYNAGDSLTGVTFTRASTAYQLIAGVWTSVTTGVARDNHNILANDSATRRSLLIEGQRTNSALGSNLFANATNWINAANPPWASIIAATSVVTGQTAYNHTGDGVTANQNRNQNIGTFVNAQTDCFYAILELPAANPTTISDITIFDATAGATVARVELTWSTLAVALLAGSSPGYGAINYGTGPNGGKLVALWVLATGTASGTGAAGNTRQAIIQPLGVAASSASCIIHHAQFEANAPSPSSPIVTTTVTVTRAAETISWPFTGVPTEMAVYAKIVETGNLLNAGARVFTLGSAASGNNSILVNNATQYQGWYANGATASHPVSAAAAAQRDLVELRCYVSAAGQVTIGQSLNSGTEAAVTAGAVQLGPAFNAATIDIGSSNFSYQALVTLRVMRGNPTIAQCRTPALMPTGAVLDAQSLSTNVLRDGHYVKANDGNLYRTTRLEGQRTNAWTFSQDLTNVAWTTTNLTTTANGTVAPDGTATATVCIETTDGAPATHFWERAITGATDNTVTAVSFYVKNRGRQYVRFRAVNKANVAIFGTFDTVGGTFTENGGFASVLARQMANGWWRIEIGVNMGTGATSPVFDAYLANASTGASTYQGAGTLGLSFWGMQVEVDGVFASSYIPTTTIAVTRSADTLSFTFSYAPQASTYYTKFVESGTAQMGGSARIGEIASAGSTQPRLLFSYNNGAGYTILNDQSGGSVTSTATGLPAFNDADELRAVVNANGSVLMGQSINGAAETLGTTSAGDALPGAWSGTTLYFNQNGAGAAPGFVCLASIVIARNVQTLAQMQAFAKPTLLLDLQPGHDLWSAAGGTFSRASTAYYTDVTGTLRVAAVNAERWSHYEKSNDGNTYQTRLYEGQSTNLALWSEQFDNAYWLKQGNGAATPPVVTPNAAIAPDGNQTADQVTFVAPGVGDSSNLVSGSINPLTAGLTYTGSFYVKAATAGDVGKTIIIRHAGLSTYTGFVLTNAWQRISSSEVAAGTACNLTMSLRPGQGGSSSGTVSVLVWGAQFEAEPFRSSYIQTTSVAVTRSTDLPQVQWPTPPLAMTVYVKFVEEGNILTTANGPRIFCIEASNQVPERLLIYVNSGKYTVTHGAATNPQAFAAAAPAIGDTVELRILLFADGSVQLGQSINGAAEVVSAQSSGSAFGSAWASSVATIGTLNTSFLAASGFTRFIKLIVARGNLTLAQMQAFT